MTIMQYNREAAAAYAREWALARNPGYYDFEEIGGDCTKVQSPKSPICLSNPLPTLATVFLFKEKNL
jgi:hypothetical protein